MLIPSVSRFIFAAPKIRTSFGHMQKSQNKLEAYASTLIINNAFVSREGIIAFLYMLDSQYKG